MNHKNEGKIVEHIAHSYIGDFAGTNDFKFLELVRTLDATLEHVNSSGLTTGQNCCRIVEFLVNFPNMESFVSKELYEHVQKELVVMATKKPGENVRGSIKSILMFPTNKYLDWVPFGANDETLADINVKFQQIFFKIQLIDGKVYALCQNDVSIYDMMKHISQISQLNSNDECCHVTIVNSDVVAKIGIELVADFIFRYHDAFNVSTGKIKSTFSNDWSRFSQCFVIEINSNYLNTFVDDFNNKFKTGVKIIPHITFAIRSRNLW